MRFIIDENLPPRLATWLTGRGHDAVHVRQNDSLRSDDDVARFAVREGYTIVTKDSDFDPPRFGERVLQLGIGNCSNKALFAWLESNLDQAVARLVSGETYVVLD
jgi:predicted nuclease of predicted toxin-antitoxin system